MMKPWLHGKPPWYRKGPTRGPNPRIETEKPQQATWVPLNDAWCVRAFGFGRQGHGCCWETCYIFAFCGYLTAKILIFAPLPTSKRNPPMWVTLRPECCREGMCVCVFCVCVCVFLPRVEWCTSKKGVNRDGHIVDICLGGVLIRQSERPQEGSFANVLGNEMWSLSWLLAEYMLDCRNKKKWPNNGALL